MCRSGKAQIGSLLYFIFLKQPFEMLPYLCSLGDGGMQCQMPATLGGFP